MQNRFDLLIMDVMPIYMIISMNIIITMRFSMNCPTVICLPTICYVSREKPLVKTMAPGSTIILLKPKNTFLQFIYFYFTFKFIYLPLPDLILASNEFKGIYNPLARVGCKYLLFCVYVLLREFCNIPKKFKFWNVNK